MSPTSPSQTNTITFLVLFVLMPVLLAWFTYRARRTRGFPFRSISAFETMRGLLGRTAESGKQVHLTMGAAGVGGAETVAVTAGLSALRYMADQGATFGYTPVVTVADPTLMLAAQDVLHVAYQRAGRVASYLPTDVQMIAPEPAAYAAGAIDQINRGAVAANVLIGHFGEEYLLLGEPGAQRNPSQVVGSDTVNAQPLMWTTSDRPLIGEELFALPAYLQRRPVHIASLYLQDIMRILVIVAVVIGVLLKTLR
jgi:hypothetical protein